MFSQPLNMLLVLLLSHVQFLLQSHVHCTSSCSRGQYVPQRRAQGKSQWNCPMKGNRVNKPVNDHA